MKVLLLLENYSTSGTTNLEILGFNVFVVVSFLFFFFCYCLKNWSRLAFKMIAL